VGTVEVKGGSVEVWKCGSVEVWKCGSVKVWKCESVGVSKYGVPPTSRVTARSHLPLDLFAILKLPHSFDRHVFPSYATLLLARLRGALGVFKRQRDWSELVSDAHSHPRPRQSGRETQ
jgi:hypothetical protein